MNFYLTSPFGTIPYRKLEQYALHRLRFLTRLNACKDGQEQEEVLLDAAVVGNSDCLISGTGKDLISHHILRLLLGGDDETSSFFAQSEEALFLLRCDGMSPAEWEMALRQWEQDLNKINGHHPRSLAIQRLESLCLLIKQTVKTWSHLAQELSVKQDGPSLNVPLPFQSVLRLVARRDITLDRGQAIVPVHLLKTVFAECFAFVMEQALQQAKVERQRALRDARMKRLGAVLKQTYRCEGQVCTVLPPDVEAVELRDLWAVAQSFPLCMREVMEALRTHHRLRHHDRIQLTLFLKELGLSLHEALLLWKREYSTPYEPRSSSRSAAPKGWLRNERHYLYNIRHLYGLEGGRVDYKGHSCASLQSRQLSCGEVGGCPFVSLDERSLTQSLERLGLVSTDLEELLSLKRQRRYEDACKKHLRLALASGRESQSKKAGAELCQMPEFVEGTKVEMKARSSKPLQMSHMSSNNLSDNLHKVLPGSSSCQVPDSITTKLSSTAVLPEPALNGSRLSAITTFSLDDPDSAGTLDENLRNTEQGCQTGVHQAVSTRNTEQGCQTGVHQAVSTRNTEQGCQTGVHQALSTRNTEQGCQTGIHQAVSTGSVTASGRQGFSPRSLCHIVHHTGLENVTAQRSGVSCMSCGLEENEYHYPGEFEGSMVYYNKDHFSRGKRRQEATLSFQLQPAPVCKHFKFSNKECKERERTDSSISVSGIDEPLSERTGKCLDNLPSSCSEGRSQKRCEYVDRLVLHDNHQVLEFEPEKWSESKTETLTPDLPSSAGHPRKEHSWSSSLDALNSHPAIRMAKELTLTREDEKDNLAASCAVSDQIARTNTQEKSGCLVENYTLRKPSEYFFLFQKFLKKAF